MTLIFSFLAILALGLFEGKLRQQCFDLDMEEWVDDPKRGCSLNSGYGRQCNYESYNQECEYKVDGTINDNPNYGFVGFDYFGMAFLTIFSISTLEGWADIMYRVMESVGGEAMIFFVIAYLLGGLYVVNLIIAIICEGYISNDQEQFISSKISRSLNSQKLTELQYCEKILTLQPSTKFGKWWKKVREVCMKISLSDEVSQFILLIIVINIVCLSMEYRGQSKEEAAWVTFIQNICSIIFTIEIITKTIAFSFKRCKREFLWWIDIMIIVSFLLELTISDDQFSLSSFRILRLLRVLRAVKLVQKWENLHVLIQTVMESGEGLFYFLCLVSLYLFIFSVAGMELFGNEFKIDPATNQLPRRHYDTFYQSLISTFQVLTGEEWNLIMYEGMRVRGWLGGVYFVLSYFFGNIILVNLFLVILLSNLQKVDPYSQKSFFEQLDSKNDLFSFFSTLFQRVFQVLGNIFQSIASIILSILTKDQRRQDQETKEEEEGDVEMKAMNATENTKKEEEDIFSKLPSSNNGSNPFISKTHSPKPFSSPKTRKNRKGFMESNLISPNKTKNREDNTKSSKLIPMVHQTPSKKEIKITRGGGSYKTIQNSKFQHSEKPLSSTKSKPVLEKSSIEDINSPQIDSSLIVNVQKESDTVLDLSEFDHLLDEPPPPLGVSPKRADVFEKHLSEFKESKKGSTRFHLKSSIPFPETNKSLNGSDPNLFENDLCNRRAIDASLRRPEITNLITSMIIKHVGDKEYKRDGFKYSDLISGCEIIDLLMEYNFAMNSNDAMKIAQYLLSQTILIETVPSQISKENKRATYWLGKLKSESQMSFEMKSEEKDTDKKRQFLQRKGSKWIRDHLQFMDDSTLYQVHPARKTSLLDFFQDRLLFSYEQQQMEARDRRIQGMLDSNPLTCGIFSPENSIRIWCTNCVTNPFFEWGVLALIFLSCIFLALDAPLGDFGSDNPWVIYVDDVMTIIFSSELLMRIVAVGFTIPPHGFFRDSYNMLDLVVVLVSIIQRFDIGFDGGFLLALRAMRALRPLRLLSHLEGLKVIVEAIIKALPSAFNVSLLVFIIFTMFAIVGIQLWSGKLDYCDGNGIEDYYSLDRDECFGTVQVFDTSIYEYVNITREWTRHSFSFDSFPLAMLTLFEVSSIENWPEVLNGCIDAPNAQGLHPVRDINAKYSFFFVIFIIIGGFFIMNLFIGEIFIHFFIFIYISFKLSHSFFKV